MLYSAGAFHLLALLGTLVVEGGCMLLWASRAYPHPWRAMLCTLGVNLVIHTLFWYSQPLFSGNWPLSLYGAEALVVLIEGALYGRFLSLSGTTPWLRQASLNLASLLTGLWLWQLLL